MKGYKAARPNYIPEPPPEPGIAAVGWDGSARYRAGVLWHTMRNAAARRVCTQRWYRELSPSVPLYGGAEGFLPAAGKGEKAWEFMRN